ncbi:MAG: LysR family transcriptional regulator [Xanthomonadales bacterium]|nr:LysR family transcriptional regulator [Xanthomonadales bacterium]
MRSFARVAERQSFVRAADDLGISAAMVSRHVAWLEAQLDVRLLNRSTRNVELSEAGARYYPRCVALLERLEEVESDVSGLGAHPRGVLRVSTPMDFGQLYLRPAVREFLSLYPDISIEWHLDDRRVPLLDEGYDVAIRIGQLEDTALYARTLGAACIGCFAAPDYLAARGAPTAPRELQQHDVLEYALSPTPGRWRFGNTEVPVSWRLSANNGRVLADAAARALGIVRLPEFLVRDLVADGALLEVLEPYRSPPLPVHALYLHRRFRPAKVTAFLDFMAQCFASRPEQFALPAA